MATVEASPERRRFEHLVLDFLAYLEFERGLSRNTLEAYRSDLLQFGRFLAERGTCRALDAGPADVGDFLTALAAGDDGRSRPSPGHDPPQGRLPALVLPPPAPRGPAATPIPPPR